MNADILLSFLKHYFMDHIIYASTSATVLENLKRKILTEEDTLRIFEPEKLERPFSLNDRLLMDRFRTFSFFHGKFKETFVELTYKIQCLENSFTCFLLVKLVSDASAIVFLGLEIQEYCGAPCSTVGTMLSATFRLFIFSLQTPMYASEENRRCVKLPLENAIGNELSTTPMYEENPTPLNLQVHIVIHLMLINSICAFTLPEMLPWIQLLMLTEMLYIRFSKTVLTDLLLTLLEMVIVWSIMDCSTTPLQVFLIILRGKFKINKKKCRARKPTKKYLTTFSNELTLLVPVFFNWSSYFPKLLILHLVCRHCLVWTWSLYHMPFKTCYYHFPSRNG